MVALHGWRPAKGDVWDEQRVEIEREIDELVYELYGVTEEERRIVEEERR